ncbi:conserved hypothetical protein [Citreicella sp. SE45]|nr:conserved hypothetical protein [Citreicella sp. SE45]
MTVIAEGSGWAGAWWCPADGAPRVGVTPLR